MQRNLKRDKIRILVVALILLIGFIVLFVSSYRMRSARQTATIIATAKAEQHMLEELHEDATVETVATVPAASNERDYDRPFHSSPSVGQYQEEAKVNPHEAPESLVAFAQEIGIKMAAAKKSVEEAKKVFAMLKSCSLASGEDEVLTVRAVCAEAAQELSEKYPEAFAQEFEQMLNQMDDQRLKLMIN